jgi:hypothetical protein
MLKRIPILVFLIFLLLKMNAQESFTPSTYIGFHGGANFSAVSFTPSLKQQLVNSPSFGIIFRHVSEPHIGIQIEVNKSGKGWKEIIDSVGTYKRKLETIDVPIMASFIAGSKLLRIAFNLGPYVSYLRQDKETIDIADMNDYRAHYQVDLVNKWEFGFTGGISIEFHTKLGAFGIGASYNHSLTNLFPLNKGTFYFNASRSQVIHADLCYLIKL